MKTPQAAIAGCVLLITNIQVSLAAIIGDNSENVLDNLKIAQIPKLRRTSTHMYHNHALPVAS